ncbi:MAG TPA: hypothetical protein VGR71_15095, partial [Nitrospira sp.]|nr:hypothetical protein [Nitrospira sp.]
NTELVPPLALLTADLLMDSRHRHVPPRNVARRAGAETLVKKMPRVFFVPMLLDFCALVEVNPDRPRPEWPELYPNLIPRFMHKF